VAGVQVLVPALSLTVVSAALGGKLPEIDFLLRHDPQLLAPGQPEPVLVVPLARDSAIQVGAAAHATPDDLLAAEVRHVVWCATGRNLDGTVTRWPVATYSPDRYAGLQLPLIVL
jgi:hypothetical protein